MEDVGEMNRKRFQFLERLYRLSGGDEHTWKTMWDIGQDLGFDKGVTERIAQYLEGEMLIEFKATGGLIGITHGGVVAVEDALSDTEPVGDKPLVSGGEDSEARSGGSTASDEDGVGGRIFIIHGHDIEMKNAVQLVVSRAQLDDVVLHEQPDRGRTVIDKLIEESAHAAYAVALLSPDDALAHGILRARQNVILEIGYFLGKLGKSRVRLLKRGDVEIPSDLSGILYEDYDDGGNWRIKLLRELKAAGIEFDVDKAVEKY